MNRFPLLYEMEPCKSYYKLVNYQPSSYKK